MDVIRGERSDIISEGWICLNLQIAIFFLLIPVLFLHTKDLNSFRGAARVKISRRLLLSGLANNNSNNANRAETFLLFCALKPLKNDGLVLQMAWKTLTVSTGGRQTALATVHLIANVNVAKVHCCAGAVSLSAVCRHSVFAWWTQKCPKFISPNTSTRSITTWRSANGARSRRTPPVFLPSAVRKVVERLITKACFLSHSLA